MARVFSAVDIRDEKLLKELERVQERLDLGFNPVNPEQMHITLQFFEDVSQNQIQKLKNTLDGIELEPFKVEVKGLGAFPSEDYIRVVWADAQHEKLHKLYRQVSLHDVPFDNEENFTPHITLMRVKNITPDRKRKLKKTIEEFKDHSFGELRVDSIRLFRSDLGPHGPEYTEIYKKKL